MSACWSAEAHGEAPWQSIILNGALPRSDALKSPAAVSSAVRQRVDFVASVHGPDLAVFLLTMHGYWSLARPQSFLRLVSTNTDFLSLYSSGWPLSSLGT